MEEVGFFETFWNGVLATSPLEWTAVLTGIAYVVLASYRSIWCWVFAFVSSSIYVFICFNYGLFIESVLQLFYVAMAIVGWVSWNKSENKVKPVGEDLLDSAMDQKKILIHTWGWEMHVMNVIASGLLAFAVGWIFNNFTNQANPYMDAFTTVFSLVATFMVTLRVLENWIYWVMIDIVSIFLYSSRELYLSSVLYLLFTILAVVGFVAWLKEYKAQRA